MAASAFRFPSQSLSAPENALVIDAVDSATPSKAPIASGEAPTTVNKYTGSNAWIISDEISIRSETKPSAHMPAGTSRQSARRVEGVIAIVMTGPGLNRAPNQHS